MTVFIKAVNIWTLHEKESMVSNKFNSIMRATLPSKLHAYNYALNTTGEWLKTWLWLLARPIHTGILCDIHCQNTSCTHMTYTVWTLPVHTEIPCDVQSEHFLYTQKYHVIYTVWTLQYTQKYHMIFTVWTLHVLPEIPRDIHCLNTSCTHRNITWSSLSEHFLYTQKYHMIYTVWTLQYTQNYHMIFTVWTLPVLPEIPCDIHRQNTSCIHRNIMWYTLNTYCHRNITWYTLCTLPVRTEILRDVHCLNTSCTHRNTMWYACLNTSCTSAKWQKLTSSVFTSCIGFEAVKPYCRLQSTFCRQAVFKLQNHTVIYNQHSAD